MEKSKNKKLWISIPITEHEQNLIMNIKHRLKEDYYQEVSKGRIARALAVAGLNHVNPDFAIEDPMIIFQLESMGAQYPCEV